RLPVDKADLRGDNGCMADVWLHTNRRALLWSMLPPALLALLGAALVAGYLRAGIAERFAGGGLTFAGAAAPAALLWQSRRPRLAVAGGHLLVYLRRGAPVRVPLEVIECFLLGQATSQLPAAGRKLKTATVLIRLCPREPQWVRGEVDPRFGEWRDSHF